MEIQWETSTEGVRIHMSGPLDGSATDDLNRLCSELPTDAHAALYLDDVHRVDARGTAALLKLAKHLRGGGGSLNIASASEQARRGLELFGFRSLQQESETEAPSTPALFETLGGQWYTFKEGAWDVAILLYDLFVWSVLKPLRGKGLKWHLIVAEITRSGWKALPIVVVVAFLFGLVMAVNGAYLLGQWGQNRYIADLVGLALAREMGPLLAGILLAARSGADITAQIGTMQVKQEIDAMWTLGMNPARFLTVPKVLALMVVLPWLALVAETVGMFGGYLASTTAFDVAGATFVDRLIYAVQLRDVLTGMGKSIAFGLIVGVVGCSFGFSVRGGAQEVGRATTRSVVWSIVLIVVADMIFSWIFYWFA